jgi:predicted nucleic acid-binding protein
VTRYLVDTDVISAAAPTKAVTRFQLTDWMGAHSADLFLSAVTIAEIAEGIAKAQRGDAKRKASDLSAWLETVLHLYADRVLSFDAATAQIAGTLAVLARGRGHSPGFADAAIAATARHHGLTILSRNERHFAAIGMTVINPFEKLSAERVCRRHSRLLLTIDAAHMLPRSRK